MMDWSTVALVLGLAFNVTLILIAMSEGAQEGMSGGRHEKSDELGGNDTETEETLSRSDTTRSL